jgi:DNA mismatch repair protein MutL
VKEEIIMPIQVLDRETINKIAAGEVIERPSSVVKELVENAIDAGATAITVEIKEGGISFIRITDNGCGIKKEELPLAFLSHATSKISSVEDLMNVSSLGFRGEALSSIAAISQIELVTKTSDSFTGSRYVIEGGKEVSLEEVGVPDGTTFIVRNLFYNTPVRRKFLKTAVTEGSYVNALIEHLALSHPDISFRFISNNQNRLHTSGNTNLKDIIYSIYGRDITNNLIEVNASTQDIKISGFIGKPQICRGNRGFENYYINGRYIKSRIVTNALEEAYKGFIMPHNYPFTALHFEITPSILDVNVHPTKMELRFSKNEFVYQFVLDSVKNALRQRELVPEVTVGNTENEKLPHPEAQSIPPSKPNLHFQPQKDYTASAKEALPLKPERLPEPFEIKRQEQEKQLVQEEKKIYGQTAEAALESRQLDLFEEKLLDKNKKNSYRIIGQLFSTYWLIEFEDNFYIMDQHAAHEKVLYERLMKIISTRQNDTQMLMPPVVLSLNMREEQVINEYSDVFSRIGYEIEDFGGKEIKVTGIPATLPKMDYKQLLTDIIDTLTEDLSQSKKAPELIAERVASMSCKAAVKGNNTLSFAEADELVSELMDAENPYNCPHGRPTLIKMTKYEIEKKFKRII